MGGSRSGERARGGQFVISVQLGKFSGVWMAAMCSMHFVMNHSIGKNSTFEIQWKNGKRHTRIGRRYTIRKKRFFFKFDVSVIIRFDVYAFS